MKLTFLQKIILRILLGGGVFVILLTLLIHFEQDSPQSSLVDYPNAMWYAIVSLTSVGYGDLYPATVYGRGIGYIFVLFSTGVYVYFVGSIAAMMTTIKQNRKLGLQGTSFSGHSIIIGWDEIARNVTDELIGVHKRVAIVTDTVKDIDSIHEKYSKHKDLVYVLHTNYSNYETLKKANIETANVIFLNLKSDTDKLVYVLHAKKLYPDKNYVVILENAELKNAFLNAGANYAVAKNEIASKLLASYIFEPDVAEYSEDILSFAENEMDYDIKQYRITMSNPYKDREYQYTFFDLKKRFNIVVIGISKRNKMGKRVLIKNPGGNLRIEEDDYLIMITNGRSSDRLEQIFKVNEGI